MKSKIGDASTLFCIGLHWQFSEDLQHIVKCALYVYSQQCLGTKCSVMYCGDIREQRLDEFEFLNKNQIPEFQIL
jgi:hypothetical protein